MRKYLIFLFLGVAILLFYKSILYLSKHGVVNLNTLSITTTSSLDKSKIKVIQGAFSFNRKNDSELFYDWSKENIIFDGCHRYRPHTEHGENDFLIIYDEKYYFQFRHYQTNERENNSFNIHLSKADTSLYLEVNIDKGFSFKRQMNRISESRFLLTNRPLDSIHGGSYNGIELR